MIMELCDTGHSQIAYTCNKCPLCEQIDATSAVEGERDELKQEVADLEQQLVELKSTRPRNVLGE